jgi:hypothetical protein
MRLLLPGSSTYGPGSGLRLGAERETKSCNRTRNQKT